MKQFMLGLLLVSFSVQLTFSEGPTKETKNDNAAENVVAQEGNQQETEQLTEHVQEEVPTQENPKIYTIPLITLGSYEMEELSTRQALSVIAGCLLFHSFIFSLDSMCRKSTVADKYLLKTNRIMSYGVLFQPLHLAYQSLIQKMVRKLKSYPMMDKLLSEGILPYLNLDYLPTFFATVTTLIIGAKAGSSIGCKINKMYFERLP